MKNMILVAVGLCVCCLGKVAAIADTIVVDPNGFADYTTIQEAIDNSFNGDVVEVWPGTYHERINLYGLEITVTGTNPDDMEIVYGTIINGGMTGNTVTFDSGEDESTILRGLTVENGNTGIYCYYSDPLIQKCVIRYSKSSSEAGIRGSNSSPVIEECTIRENAGRGIYGCDGPILDCEISENSSYGLYNCDGLILDCVISENSSYGLYNCDGEIKDCEISSNTSDGLYECDGIIRNCIIQTNANDGLDHCDGEIYNCLISGNGGYGLYRCHSQLRNCTIVGNISSGVRFYGGTATVANNIIVNNGGYGIYFENGTLVMKYNNIWGNGSGNYFSTPPGETDTHSNPRFAVDGYWDVDVWVEGDYHLQSIAGRWLDTAWAYDAITSPCIDAGDPTSSYFTEPEPNGNRMNQGLYGDTIYASKSPFGPDPYCTEAIPGDVNGDCKLDMNDMAEIFSHWLECNLEPASACDD